jgi:type I restriction enzyme, R subunit
VFDYCGNFVFFHHYIPRPEGRLPDSLSKRLFITRLELIGALDQDGADFELRKETAATLHAEVASMNLDNFLVRPKRRIIEQYLEPAAWQHLDRDDLHTLATDVAGTVDLMVFPAVTR